MKNKIYIIFILVFLFHYTSDCYSQETNRDSISDIINEPIKKKYKPGLIGEFGRTKHKIIKLGKELNAIDTCFITPNLYNLAFMLQHSTWYEQYRLGSKTQSIRLAPNFSYKLGIFFGWKWIFLGYTFDIKDIFGNNNKSNKTELNLNLYTSKFGVDLYYRKTGNDFKIRSFNGFDEKITYKDLDFDGFNSSIKGINAYWIFNHKHFSYPALFSQSTNQRRSCGSLMAGLAYSQHNIKFDYNELPEEMKVDLSPGLMFKRIKYSDYSINVGYGYNWVFKKNWASNLSLLPAIAYKKSKIESMTEEIKDHWTHNINFDLITRAAVVYNDSKYYAGMSLLIHSYNYNKYNFSVSNSFGSLNFYVGFNFWKKQEYKEKQ